MSKTDENLYTAFVGEAKAAMRLLGFAEKADKEGYPQMAKLFRAIGAAERIHATKHLRLLKIIKSTEENLESNVREAHGRNEILGTVGRYGGYVKTGWCGREECEAEIKEQVAAEIVMLPLDRDEEPVHDTCGVCGEEAVETAYFAKNY